MWKQVLNSVISVKCCQQEPPSILPEPFVCRYALLATNNDVRSGFFVVQKFWQIVLRRRCDGLMETIELRQCTLHTRPPTQPLFTG